MNPDGAAHRLSPLLGQLFGDPPPLRLRAWDGSETAPPGAPDAPVVVLRSRRALRRLLWQPGELGLAEAYITGDLDIEGDLADGLRSVWGAVRERGPRSSRPAPAVLARAAG
ncbi:MAG: SAM-dependent methyltransferase, partial [Streptomyces sp.]